MLALERERVSAITIHKILHVLGHGLELGAQIDRWLAL